MTYHKQIISSLVLFPVTNNRAWDMHLKLRDIRMLVNNLADKQYFTRWSSSYPGKRRFTLTCSIHF